MKPGSITKPVLRDICIGFIEFDNNGNNMVWNIYS